MTKSSFTIGIDCRLAGSLHAGIGRYIENLILRLPKLSPETHWIYFFSDSAQAKAIFGEKPPKNAEFVYVPIRHYSLLEQVKLPAILEKYKLDLLHVPHFNIPLFYKGKIVVTIHDLLWHEYKGTEVTTLPAWQYWVKYKAYLYTVNKAVKKAAKIFVPAETIRKTVQKYYPAAKTKVTVTQEGVDEKYARLAEKQLTTEWPAQKKLIYVGSLYPHKNVKLVIEALKQLPEYCLKIVGSRSVFQEQIRAEVNKRHLQNQVEFLGFVPDEELIELFKQSTALVQPSFSEGFGLTGVEAMAAGLPVLASDIPIFQEVYQDAAEYFEPHSAESFVSAVKKLETKHRSKIQQKGYQVVAQYSWQKMAEETMAGYMQVLSPKSI